MDEKSDMDEKCDMVESSRTNKYVDLKTVLPTAVSEVRKSNLTQSSNCARRTSNSVPFERIQIGKTQVQMQIKACLHFSATI